MADYKLRPLRRLEDDHKHWRSRAMQMRRLAEGVAEAQARETMCVIADSYDLLAELGENRERAAAGYKNYELSGFSKCCMGSAAWQLPETFVFVRLSCAGPDVHGAVSGKTSACSTTWGRVIQAPFIRGFFLSDRDDYPEFLR